MEMARPSREYQAFRNLTDRLLAVSKETVDKRIAAYKAERDQMPHSLRQGRNPKVPKGRADVEK
jgi:hypothetical protein